MHSYVSSSTQQVSAYRNGELVHLTLPSAKRRVCGHNIRWGNVEEIGCPAYWTAQAWMWEIEEPDHYRLGRSLREEVLACILGGYGIPAEVGLAAYARLREAPATDLHDEDVVRALLAEPLPVHTRAACSGSASFGSPSNPRLYPPAPLSRSRRCALTASACPSATNSVAVLSR